MAALDSTLTWDQRLGRWANAGTVVGIVVAAIVWAVGLIVSIPWWVGLLAGLVAWVVILNTFVALGRWSQPNAPVLASTSEPESRDTTPQLSEAEREDLQ